MDNSTRDRKTPSPSPWQHRVHPVTSSNTNSPRLEAKNLSWDCDWPGANISNSTSCNSGRNGGENSLDWRCQGQPASKDPLPGNHVTSALTTDTSFPLKAESFPSYNNKMEEDQKVTTKEDCYDRQDNPLLAGGNVPGGNTFDPPKRRPGPAPQLCPPYALNSPLYRPYPYVHGRYGNSESPIASLQCGLNKLSKEQTNADSKTPDGAVVNSVGNTTNVTPGVNSKKKKKDKKAKKNPLKLRVKQPENYMGLAILICVLFNCPMGVAAILVSRSATKHFSDGDMAGGRHRALCSLVLSLVSIVVSVLVVILVVFLVTSYTEQ